MIEKINPIWSNLTFKLYESIMKTVQTGGPYDLNNAFTFLRDFYRTSFVVHLHLNIGVKEKHRCDLRRAELTDWHNWTIQNSYDACHVDEAPAQLSVSVFAHLKTRVSAMSYRYILSIATKFETIIWQSKYKSKTIDLAQCFRQVVS